MIKVYKNLLWLFKEEWKKYFAMLVLLLLLSFLAIVPAKILGYSINEITAGNIDLEKILLLFFSLLAIPIFRYFLDFSYHYLINSQGQKISYKLKQNYISHLFELDSKVFETYSKGELITRVTDDMNSLTVAATTLLQEIVYNSSLLIFTITTMAVSISLSLTIASVTLMPIGITILNRIRTKMRKYYKIHRIIYADLCESLLESIEGVKVIRAYVEEENDIKKVHEAIHKDIKSWRKIVRFEQIFVPCFETVYAVCYFIAFGYGTYQVITQQITIGELVTFSLYIGMLYGPILALSNMYNVMNNAIVANDRYFEIMNLEPDVKDKEHVDRLISFNKIRFENVSFKYPFDNQNVINGITFNIYKGQTIGIVGPTGAGKSTLIRQLLREFNVTQGNVLIDDIDIVNYKIRDVRNLVGYVPQSHILFNKSVDENILVGKPSATHVEVQKAIKIADFQKDLDFLNEGLRTMVSESGRSLSGGQKQRLSIARAIIKDPEILILDDSLSAVDGKTEQNIIASLKEYRSNKTNIIVAHRFSAIREADLIIVLEDGKITQMGKHEGLMSIDGWYKEQYIKQNKIED